MRARVTHICQVPNKVPKRHERFAHAFTPEKGIATKIPHGSIAVIFRLSVATVAGNVHAVGRYQTPVWPTGYIGGDTASRETYSIPILSGLPLRSCRPSALILHTCLYVKLQVLVIVWREGRLTFRNVSSTFPIFFQPVVWRRDAAIFLEKEEKRKNIPLTIHDVVYSGYVLCRPQRCSNSSASVRSCVLEEKGNETKPVSRPPRSFYTAVSDSTTSPSPSPDPSPREVEPFRNLPMAKGRFEDCACLASNPRFFIS